MGAFVGLYSLDCPTACDRLRARLETLSLRDSDDLWHAPSETVPAASGPPERQTSGELYCGGDRRETAE
jgi:hypothetical protein